MPKLSHSKMILIEELLLVLIIGLAGVLVFWKPWGDKKTNEDPTFKNAADSLQQKIEQSDLTWQQHWKDEYRKKYGNRKPAERFPFNPNRVDSFSLYRMGYTPGQIHGIMNYRRKGGIYKNADEFNRFGWRTEKDFSEIKPFIRIDSADLKQAQTYDKTDYPVKKDTILELNSADTAELKLLHGIASGYAYLIVKQRKALGGFSSIEQLKEIVPEATYEQIKDQFTIDPQQIEKISVNRSGISRLRMHPYLTFEQAKALYELRRRQVTINNIQELQQLPEFTSKDIQRLEPYLDFN